MMDVAYYLHNFWQENGDPKVSSDFMFMSGGPWKLLGLIACYAFASLAIGPIYMRDRKPFDLRPWMLVFNGFMFGVNGAGFLIALWVTQMGTNTWSCSEDNENWNDIRGASMKYLGFVYMCIKVLDFLNTAFDVLRKKENADIKGQVIHNSCLAFFAYLGLKFYPRGIFCFLPLTDTLVQSFRLAYLVLASAGSALKFSLWWKKYVTLVQLAQHAALIVHSLCMAMVPNCAGPVFVKTFVLAYGTASMSYYISFYKRNYLATSPATKAE